jgi:hypothetical protein
MPILLFIPYKGRLTKSIDHLHKRLQISSAIRPQGMNNVKHDVCLGQDMEAQKQLMFSNLIRANISHPDNGIYSYHRTGEGIQKRSQPNTKSTRKSTKKSTPKSTQPKKGKHIKSKQRTKKR